jgi:pyridoxamine 5'-phosphate oxidase family protein
MCSCAWRGRLSTVLCTWQQELTFLQAQLLASIATVDNDEQPIVDALDFEFNGTCFYIGGCQFETTRKYKNIVACRRKEAFFSGVVF